VHSSNESCASIWYDRPVKGRRIVSAWAFVAAIACAEPAAADLYQWTDAAGVTHYTSDPDSIPEAYRADARDIGSPRTRETTPAETHAGTEPGLMRLGGGPVIAPVQINGVALRLMVDTGADRTVISPAAVARLGLPPQSGREVRILGVAGSAVASEMVVPQIEVAGARMGPLHVIVHDTPGDSIDGLLGRDVLDHFTLTVDGTAGRATLTPR
jgi:hypothetical protein